MKNVLTTAIVAVTLVTALALPTLAGGTSGPSIEELPVGGTGIFHPLRMNGLGDLVGTLGSGSGIHTVLNERRADAGLLSLHGLDGAIPTDINDNMQVTANAGSDMFLYDRLLGAVHIGVGKAVGVSDTFEAVGNQNGKPFQYGEGVMYPIAGQPAHAIGVDNAGEILCQHVTLSGSIHSYVLAGITINDIPSFRGCSAKATYISHSGYVAGVDVVYPGTAQERIVDGFTYTVVGGKHILQPLPGTVASDPIAVNGKGNAIGWSYYYNGASVATVWINGAPYSLYGMMGFTPNNYFAISDLTDMNNQGQFCGWGAHNGHLVSFIGYLPEMQ